MSDQPLTPAQEARVRELASVTAAEMIGRVLQGAGERIQEAVAGSIVLLPVLHTRDIAAGTVRPSSGNGSIVSGGICETRMREIAHETIDEVFPMTSDEELTPP